MRVCPKCGHENADDTDFCVSCREYLRWDETDSGRSPAVVADAWPEPEQTPAEPAADEAEPAPPEAAALPAEPVLVTLGTEGGGEPVVIEVEAGVNASVEASIRNQTGVVGRYDLVVGGIPADWVTVTPSTVSLLPYGTSETGYEQQVSVLFHPPRSPEAEAREWPFALGARRAADPQPLGSATGTLAIAPYREFEVRMRPQRAEGGGSAELSAVVHNRANAPLEVLLRGEDPDGEVDFRFSPPRLTVPLGREGAAQVEVSAPRPTSGAARERLLTVYADAGEQLASAAATFVQRPRVTRWRLVGLRVLLTLVAAAALIGGSFLRWGDDGGTPLDGVCRTAESAPVDCLSYAKYIGLAGFAEESDVDFDPPLLEEPFNFVSSIGFLTIALGVLAMLGLRTGRPTWIAGALAVVAVVVYLVTAGTAGVGAGLALAGGVVGMAAGLLAR